MTEQRTAGRLPVLGIIAFVLLAALLLTLAILSAIKGVRTAESYGDVVRVEDGDTFVVNMDGTEETVTLAGVLAPLPPAEGQEASLDNCLAEESADSLSGMLEPGDAVQLQFPGDAAGPDGTRLALARSGGEVVNIAQVEAGLAVPVRDQPTEQLGEELRRAQETARSEQAGLYSPSRACTLPGRVAPVIAMLRELPEAGPGTSAEADQQIETVTAAVEEGVTAEKVFATIDPEGVSLSSLAWAQDVPRLQERLDRVLAETEAHLASLQTTRKVLLTRERAEVERQREEARQAEIARQQEAARQAEIARQEAARQEAARQEAARQEAARQEAARQAEMERQAEAERRAEEAEEAEEEARRRAEESASASPTPSESPSESASPSPESSSPSPSSSRSSADADSEDDEEESSGSSPED